MILNKRQVKAVLLDKKELEYRRKINKQDSLLIQEFNNKILNYKEEVKVYKLIIDSKQTTIDRLRFQNKLIIIGSGIIVGGITYMSLKK